MYSHWNQIQTQTWYNLFTSALGGNIPGIFLLNSKQTRNGKTTSYGRKECLLLFHRKTKILAVISRYVYFYFTFHSEMIYSLCTPLKQRCSKLCCQQMHPKSDIFAFALKHFPQNGAHDDSYDNMSVCVWACLQFHLAHGQSNWHTPKASRFTTKAKSPE